MEESLQPETFEIKTPTLKTSINTESCSSIGRGSRSSSSSSRSDAVELCQDSIVIRISKESYARYFVPNFNSGTVATIQMRQFWKDEIYSRLKAADEWKDPASIGEQDARLWRRASMNIEL